MVAKLKQKVRRKTIARLKTNHNAVVGFFLVLLFVLVAIVAPLIANHDPYEVNIMEKFQPPNSKYWFGTDKVGMDIFSRVVYGTRVDLSVAIISVILSIAIGVPIGLVIGYCGGKLDEIAMRILDCFQAFPPLIMAMVVVAVLGNNPLFIVGAIALMNFPSYVRLVRAEAMARKERLYIEAALCVGNTHMGIIFKHLAPNCMGPIMTQAPMTAGWSLLTTAMLSFIGLGIQYPTPEWGAMIQQGAENIISGEWWIAFFPGVVIVICVLGFNLLSEGLHDLIDPQRRGA